MTIDPTPIAASLYPDRSSVPLESHPDRAIDRNASGATPFGRIVGGDATP
ncbi:MAG: hypothetical protein VKK80_08535 [Prochlorothrix sp.]|nr:hypothetical protein [Prochlorothrix sp.]